MLELAERLKKLEALEYELREHRRRLKGVRRRLFFVFIPLLLVALAGWETPFRVQIVAAIIGASLFDSLIHQWRVKTLERRREVLLEAGERPARDLGDGDFQDTGVTLPGQGESLAGEAE